MASYSKIGLGEKCRVNGRIWAVMGLYLLVSSVTYPVFAGTAQAGFGFGDPKLSEEESSQITKLLDTFSKGCTLTNGPSADAIFIVQGLSATIKASLSSPACASLAGVVTSLDGSALQAQSLIPKVNDSYVEDLEQQVNALEKQKQEITTLLTQATDPAEVAALRTQLYSVRIELAGAMSSAHDSALNDQQTRRSQALRLLLSSTNQAVNQVLANESCWVGQPGVLQQVAGAGTMLSANAALMTPASQTAVLLTSGMSILSTLVDFLERLSVAKKVAQFDMALGSTALTCALEKMNDVYCSAQDTLNAIKKVGPKIHDPNEDPVWRGLSFLEKEIPVLLGWLQKIKSGGGANTIEDAFKKSEIELSEVKLGNSKTIFQGYLRDYQLRYDQSVDPEQKFAIVRNMIRSFVLNVCGSVANGVDSLNPICQTRISIPYMPYFLLGLTSAQYQNLIQKYSNLDFSGIDMSLLQSVGINNDYSLERTRVQYNNLHQLAQEQFDIQKKLALGQDLTLIFDEALKRNYRISNPVTAQSALESLIKSLNASSLDPRDPQKGLREQVLNSLNEILRQIISVSQKETTPEQAKDEIYKVADLKIGTSFLGDRLERIIRTDLEQLIYDSDNIDDTTRLPFLAANDAVKELRRFYQVSSLQELQESASNAQLIMNKTIDPFIKLFANPMQKAFDEFDNIARRVGGDGAAHAIALKTKMCFYFLGAMRPQDFFIKECEGLVGKSVLGLETPPFKRALFQEPMQNRACLYRNFIMKNRIRERQTQAKKYPQFTKLLLNLNSI